jgi:hypothetical protein
MPTETASSGLAGLMGPLALFAIVIGILWAILPFAVFGIKSRIDRGNELLESIRDELRRRP